LIISESAYINYVLFISFLANIDEIASLRSQ